MSQPAMAKSLDLPTVAAVAVVAYALANQIHEGIGHGGACLAVGCVPQMLTAVSFYGNEDSLTQNAVRIVAAGGTLANFAAALIGGLWLRRSGTRRGSLWFFLWLFTSINLMQATGYLMFSGIGNVGDWAVVVRDLPSSGAWRIALAVFGSAAYWLVADRSIKALGAGVTGIGVARLPTLYRCTLTAYFTGALLYVAAGAFNPEGLRIVLISAAAASLGGTSAMLWAPQVLRNPADGAFAPPALDLPRDPRWIIAAVVVAMAFIGLLGPGVSL